MSSSQKRYKRDKTPNIQNNIQHMQPMQPIQNNDTEINNRRLSIQRTRKNRRSNSKSSKEPVVVDVATQLNVEQPLTKPNDIPNINNEYAIKIIPSKFEKYEKPGSRLKLINKLYATAYDKIYTNTK